MKSECMDDHGDPLDAPRGILNGVLAGLVFFALVGGFVVLGLALAVGQ